MEKNRIYSDGAQPIQQKYIFRAHALFFITFNYSSAIDDIHIHNTAKETLYFIYFMNDSWITILRIILSFNVPLKKMSPYAGRSHAKGTT